MKAFVFPGQGAQFVGMGKDLYENNALAHEMFEKANEVLGFRITDLMFEGTEEDLRQTKVTQPAIFLHSVILAKTMGDEFKPDMVAGHSLGEFSSLVAAGALPFNLLPHVQPQCKALVRAIHLQWPQSLVCQMKKLRKSAQPSTMLLLPPITTVLDR